MISEALPDEDRGASKATVSLASPWSIATALVIFVLIARVLYLIWLSPYQLVGDEAYYWEQARHLDLSYDEKGPLLAWMIAGCCRLFGDSEWAVRLPVAIFSAIGAWGVGRLAMNVSRESDPERVGLFAVGLFLLLPAFQANAQICTQDGPLIAVWIALTAIGLRIIRNLHAGVDHALDWTIFWAIMGVGVLLKQSVLLFLVSFPIYLVIARPKATRWLILLEHQIPGLFLFVAILSPMIIWDSRHGWPMIAHTLGHLGAGGDQTGTVNDGNAFLWLGNTLGGIVGAFGPACVILMIWGCIRAARLRLAQPVRWHDDLWLMCAALPGTAFFILLSLRKPVVPSWPLPALVSLVPLVAELSNTEWKRYRSLVSGWKSRPAQTNASDARGRKPETPFHQLWVVLVGYGMVGGLILAFPPIVGRLPLIGARLQRSALKRITGHREAAAVLQQQLALLTTPDHRPPVIVTRHYMQAALYAFYLPGHPSVCTAGKYLGKRSTTFDIWPDTDLSQPHFHGRTLLLDGQGDVSWDRALVFDSIRPINDGRFYLATNFGGPRPDHPRFLNQGD